MMPAFAPALRLAKVLVLGLSEVGAAWRMLLGEWVGTMEDAGMPLEGCGFGVERECARDVVCHDADSGVWNGEVCGRSVEVRVVAVV